MDSRLSDLFDLMNEAQSSIDAMKEALNAVTEVTGMSIPDANDLSLGSLFKTVRELENLASMARD